METIQRTAKYDYVHPEKDEIIFRKGDTVRTSLEGRFASVSENPTRAGEVQVYGRYWFNLPLAYFETED